MFVLHSFNHPYNVYVVYFDNEIKSVSKAIRTRNKNLMIARLAVLKILIIHETKLYFNVSGKTVLYF
jgi:hypothetical protein